MKVSFRELDFWMAKGFGGLLNIIQMRVERFKEGFAKVTCQLLAKEMRRANELNDGIQAREEGEVRATTDLNCVDNWFVNGFSGIDRYLKTRSDEGPPIDPNVLHSMEEHIARLQSIIDKEKLKCIDSTGKAA